MCRRYQIDIRCSLFLKFQKNLTETIPGNLPGTVSLRDFIILAENTPNPLEDIDLEQLEEQLPQIEDLIDDLPDADDMYAKLHDAGCMHEVSALGIDKDTVELTLQSSPYVRNRLTLLRLAKLLEW